MAGLCWALHGCPCPRSAAVAWSALVGQEPSVPSLCLKCLCVHGCGIYPQVLGSAVPEHNKLPGCSIDIFLGVGGWWKAMVSCCTVSLPFTMGVPR